MDVAEATQVCVDEFFSFHLSPYSRLNKKYFCYYPNLHFEMVFCIYIRYYLRKDGVCIMRMVDAEFEYTYEYQGNAPKLVHTPLTDKCYLTLTQGKVLFFSVP